MTYEEKISVPGKCSFSMSYWSDIALRYAKQPRILSLLLVVHLNKWKDYSAEDIIYFNGRI